MKQVFSLTLIAVLTMSATAFAQKHDCQSCCDNDRSRSNDDRDDVGLRENGRYTENRIIDWNDDSQDDYRDRDYRSYAPRVNDCRDRDYDYRNTDYRNSDSRELSARNDFTEQYRDGRRGDESRFERCEDGQCRSGEYGARRGSIKPSADQRACQDADCSIREPHGEHSNRQSQDRGDRRFRLSSQERGRLDGSYGFPQNRQSGFGPRAGGINWTTGLQQAADLAARENLPMLVQVTAEWCPHCQQMKSEAYTDANVIDVLNRGYITVQVDADRDKAFIEQMKITSLPTTLIVAPNRQILERVEGARSAEHLLQLLQQNQSAELNDTAVVTAVE